MSSDRSSNVMQGALLIVAAMSLIGLIDNFVRYVAEEGGLWQFHLTRSIIACPLVVCFCLIRRKNLFPKRLWAVALRSALMSMALLIYFGSITLMPIAEAGATLFSSPIFVLIFSVLLLGIRVDFWRILAVAIGFIGMLLILKPDPANLNAFTLLPFLAGLLYALGQLTTRHLCADESTFLLLLGFFVALGIFGLLGTVLFTFVSIPESWVTTAPFFFTGWVSPTERFLFWTFVQAIGSLFAVSGLVRGYQVAEPTYIAVFEYSFLIFAGFWAWILWRELPDPIGFLGIFGIVVAGIIIALRSKKSSLETKSASSS